MFACSLNRPAAALLQMQGFLFMSDFIKTIGTNGQSLDFFFKRVWTSKHPKYFVTVESQGETISFDLKSTPEGWVVVPPVPGWIKEMERKLSLAASSHYTE
jgi:hypothetical protein